MDISETDSDRLPAFVPIACMSMRRLQGPAVEFNAFKRFATETAALRRSPYEMVEQRIVRVTDQTN